jgi:tape measure domain-containing protein
MPNNIVEYFLRLKNDGFSSGIKKATVETEGLNNAVNKTKNSISGLGGAIKTVVTGYVIGEIVRTTAAMEGLKNQLNFASGGAQQGAADFEWLRERANYLGLDLRTATESFAKFEAAARGTSIQGQGVKDIFDAVAQAATVMNMSSDEAAGTFRALQQMMSKGKVYAEEFNGQLGERMPIAMGVASRAMNMTSADLMKMMANGELLSEEFLPKFAQQLKSELAGSIESSRISVNANLGRMSTAFFELKSTIGEMFLPVINAVINAFVSFSNAINQNKPLFTFLIVSFVTLASIITVTTAAQWALNTAMAFAAGLTGVGWIAVAAAGAAALAVGLYAANNAQQALNNTMAGAQAQISPMSMGAKPTGQTSSKVSSTKKSGTSIDAVEARRSTNFNIDIDSLIENFTISTTNIKESSTAIKAKVTQSLIEAVNDFQILATK